MELCNTGKCVLILYCHQMGLEVETLHALEFHFKALLNQVGRICLVPEQQEIILWKRLDGGGGSSALILWSCHFMLQQLTARKHRGMSMSSPFHCGFVCVKCKWGERCRSISCLIASPQQHHRLQEQEWGSLLGPIVMRRAQQEQPSLLSITASYSSSGEGGSTAKKKWVPSSFTKLGRYLWRNVFPCR